MIKMIDWEKKKEAKIIKLPGVKLIAAPGTFMIKTTLTEEETNSCRHHVEEDVDKYTIKIEIPGTRKEDVKLYMNENTIILKATPTIKMPWTPETYRVKIKLENTVNPEEAKAKYEYGILTITIPKRKITKEISIE